MKRIKITLLLSLMIFGMQVFSQNNQTRTPQERTENQLKGINKACNLTKEQTPKVEKILLNSNIKMDELRTVKPAYKGERVEKMKAIGEEQDTQLKTVLTADQYLKYLDMKAARKEKMKERQENKN